MMLHMTQPQQCMLGHPNINMTSTSQVEESSRSSPSPPRAGREEDTKTDPPPVEASLKDKTDSDEKRPSRGDDNGGGDGPSHSRRRSKSGGKKKSTSTPKDGEKKRKKKKSDIPLDESTGSGGDGGGDLLLSKSNSSHHKLGKEKDKTKMKKSKLRKSKSMGAMKRPPSRNKSVTATTTTTKKTDGNNTQSSISSLPASATEDIVGRTDATSTAAEAAVPSSKNTDIDPNNSVNEISSSSFGSFGEEEEEKVSEVLGLLEKTTTTPTTTPPVSPRPVSPQPVSPQTIMKSPIQRSFSFTSPPTKKEKLQLKSLNTTGLLHWTDGRRLKHWDRTNFELKRVSQKSSQVKYKPIDGENYYKRVLDIETYSILRCTMSEQPHLSKYNRIFPQVGHFCCTACGKAIYSYKSKISTFDGYPGFGACISGSIELVTAKQRQQQEDKKVKSIIQIQKVVRGRYCRKTLSTICIQRIFRGSLWRGRVTKALEIVIETMMALSPPDGAENIEEKDEPPRVIDVLNDLIQKEKKSNPTTTTTTMIAPDNGNINNDESSPNTKKEEEDDKKQLQQYGDVLSPSEITSGEYNELRCMRCKSHLGNVVVEKNFGKSGQLYQERHRVNGKALKFVDDELPKKRVQEEESVLPLNETTAANQKSGGLKAKVSALQKALPSSRAGSFAITNSEPIIVGNIKSSRRASRPHDPLSQSCHQPRRGKFSNNSLPPVVPTRRRLKNPIPLSQSDHESEQAIMKSSTSSENTIRPGIIPTNNGVKDPSRKFTPPTSNLSRSMSMRVVTRSKSSTGVPPGGAGVWTTPGQIHGLPSLRKAPRPRRPEDPLSRSNHNMN